MTESGPRTLCVVPARGGSKRVPGKNLRPILGVPMIARTLGIVIESGVADHVVVSTDDPAIESVARSVSADVPFLRPATLADDHTPTAPVIAHAVSELAKTGVDGFDLVLVVYATAVLLRPEDLVAAKADLVRSGCDLVMSVGRHRAPIERAWQIDERGRGSMVNADLALTRTQDLEDAFYDAGQFYFGTVDFWRNGGDIAGSAPILHEIPPLRAFDIDTEADFLIVESLLQQQAASE